MAEGADFSKHIEFVARAMLQGTHGEPNKALSTKRELRFGKKGSLSIDLDKGTWHDHQADEGGGTLDLLKLYGGMEKHEALEWLVSQGLIEPTQGADQKPKDKFLGFMEHHPIARYQYRDPEGALAYEVWKFPKDAQRRFMQARPAPGGKADRWVVGLQDGEYGQTRDGNWFRAKETSKYEERRHLEAATYWLYRRDEVMKARKTGDVVILVEGEKDVETLRSWGFTATTNSGGAKHWNDRMSEDLSGCNIVICPDNDDSGRRRTLMLGADLKKRGALSVRILDLALHWKDMPAKADVSDWRDDAKGTKEKFAALVEGAPRWKPQAPPSKFGAITWQNMDSKAPEFEYLIEEWIPLKGRSVMGGPSQSGKSFLALELGISVARGVPFLGNHVEKRGVIYQAGEGGTGAKKRVTAYRNHNGLDGSEDIPFVFLPSKVDLFAKDGDTAALIEDIKAQAIMMDIPLGLVVIDTLATATAGADENSGKDMGVVMSNIAKIEHECDCHVMLVHHMNAKGEKLRGHTSIFADVDTVITLENDEDTKVRTAKLSKQKDDETGIKLKFELMAIDVGHNTKLNKPITSCVVLPVGEKKALQAEKDRMGFNLQPTERTIMSRILKAQDRYGRLVTDEKDGPAKAIGRQVIEWAHYMEIALEGELHLGDDAEELKRSKERIKKEFQRAKDGLERFEVIGFKTPHMWWAGKPLKGFSRTFPKKEKLWPDVSSTDYTSPGLEEMSEPEIRF